MTERINSELSARELDVLRVIAKGKSNKEIAAEYNLVESSVKGHVTNILAELGTIDRYVGNYRRDLFAPGE